MAFEMTFTDEYGAIFPQSYWRVVQTNICQADKNGMVMFYAYENAANKGKRIIGQKSYTIDEAAYLANFDADSLNPDGQNPVSAAYIHASATLDVGEGEQAISFFDGALEV